MRHEDFEIEGFIIVVTYHDENSNLLTEAKTEGTALVGTYSVKKHQPHVPGCDYHLHVYDVQNQIFAINKNGTAHDGYHGVRIPNKVYKAIQKQYPTWTLPPDKIIECFQFTYILNPVGTLTYKEVLNEVDVIRGELNLYDRIEDLKNTEGLLTEQALQEIVANKADVNQRWQELFNECVRRLQ